MSCRLASFLSASAVLTALFFLPGAPRAQQQQEKAEQEPAPITEGLPERELSEKALKKREKELMKELGRHFQTWLKEDVAYIITPEEKDAFFHLNTDEEREQFIEQFWLRRDPTPDTIENEFKEEHYRRIAYANERFRGWQSDMGMIYVIHGPPDEIEQMPAGGFYNRTPDEGGGGTAVFPFERWSYRYIEGVGDDIVLEFVDRCICGDYQLTSDPSLKDSLVMSIGHGLTLMEMMGRAKRVDRFIQGDGTRQAEAFHKPVRGQQFDRLRIHATVQKPPPVKFKDLEEMVDTKISFNLLPFELRTDYLRVTDDSILVPITVAVKKKDVTFQVTNGLHQSVVNIFGRIYTMTGRIVQTFEDVIKLDIPPSLFTDENLRTTTYYQKAIPLRPGLYKLSLALKDIYSGNVGTIEQRLAVPRFDEDQLAHSTLMLADEMERVPNRQVGSGQFVIGDTKVRPALEERFERGGKLGIYLQVYNLGVDEKSRRPDATFDYTFLRDNQPVLQHQESTANMERAGTQVTLTKLLSLASFQPGDYKLLIKVTDRVRQQTITPSAEFKIVQ